MRLFASSCANCQKPVYDFGTSTGLVALPSHTTVNGMSFEPNASARARAELAPTHAMLPGYDGYGGVVMSGVHAGSAAVFGLRSSSARRIAVIGRQRP